MDTQDTKIAVTPEISDREDIPQASHTSDAATPAEAHAVDPSHLSITSMKREETQTFPRKWLTAVQGILPVYIAVHIAFFLTTCLSYLFTHKDFDGSWVPLSSLPEAWHHWDTGLYMVIARNGYQQVAHTAFFPLYPLLERLLMYATHNPLVAGLIISDIAGFFLLLVLYQLVREDFDEERASRTVLYLSLFPTAFFLAAGYNESLFICLVLLSFYNMRHGNWWLAGMFGFFASLTRSAGVFLVLPFCYEYLQQCEFRLRHIRFNVVSGLLILLGMSLFALYCYYRFHDFLAFSHAQAQWDRALEPPWYGMLASARSIKNSGGIIGFQALRNLLDLVPDLLMLGALILMFVGPWRFTRKLWSYGIYAGVLFLFFQLFPDGGTGLFPLESVSRFLLELFPGFIVLATLGKYRMFNMNYLVISGALLFFLLTQFLTGHWVL